MDLFDFWAKNEACAKCTGRSFWYVWGKSQSKKICMKTQLLNYDFIALECWYLYMYNCIADIYAQTLIWLWFVCLIYFPSTIYATSVVKIPERPCWIGFGELIFTAYMYAIQCTYDLCILDAVTSSGILKSKQKLVRTFNSDKLGGIAFTKISKLTMCSA